MKLFIAILFIVADVVVGGPAQCYRCLENDGASCNAKQQNQTCGGDDFVNPSLGTTDCASAAIKYRDFPFNDVKYGLFRGCIDCADKKKACFAIGGYLKTKWQTLLQCEIKCCNDSKCNTQVPTLGLSQKGITVFTPDVVGPAQCQECFDDAASCSRRQRTQTCSDNTDPLGTTHCGSAKIKYRKSSGSITDGVFSGCIDCADKEAACAAIGGYLKGRKRDTLMECLIQCCNGTNCNDKAPPDQAKCNYCVEDDADDCAKDQKLQVCSSDKRSLGTSHCASMAGKFLDSTGRAQEIFYRGCIDCSDKKAACFALGGYFKGDDDDDDRLTLQKCEIECCKGGSCNKQVPTLTQDAINVFTQAASGPKQCNMCLEDDAAKCSDNQQTQVCATSPNSLGTTHCGSAVGTYRDRKGNELKVFIRGCGNCADKKAACAAIGGFLKNFRRLTQLECEIECCTGDNCNTKFPSKAPPDQRKCNYCARSDADECAKDQELQDCSSDRDSLGTSHCASMAGKLMDPSGKVQELFYRGCIDCSDKKAACFALGGYFKGNDDANDIWTLQKCAIECCKGGRCNNQVPTLTQDAINVFTQAASGPKQCNICLEDDAAKCSNNQQTQVCATSLYSLGTTHCGSAVGKYRDRKGNELKMFIRGCGNCADKKAACAAIGGFLKHLRRLTQLECEIECCTGDNCNAKFPSKDGTPARQEGHRVLLNEVLAFATVIGHIFYYF